MPKLIRVTVAMAAVGMVALLFTAPAHAGNGSAVGAGLVVPRVLGVPFTVGAISPRQSAFALIQAAMNLVGSILGPGVG
jgi:hypothetical protein